MVSSKEQHQTTRFRWMEKDGEYWVFDMQAAPSGNMKHLGDPSKLFCNEHEEDCLQPGTQRFYDALNSYFEHEQADIAEKHYGWVIGEQPVNSKGVG